MSKTIFLHHTLVKSFVQSLELFHYDKGWQDNRIVKLSALEVKDKALFITNQQHLAQSWRAQSMSPNVP